MGSENSFSADDKNSHDSFEQSPRHQRMATIKRKRRDISSEENFSWSDNDEVHVVTAPPFTATIWKKTDMGKSKKPAVAPA